MWRGRGRMSHQSAQEVAEGLGVMLVLPGGVRR